MKCPGCGSSASAERTEQAWEGETAFACYACSCGTEWTASYKLDYVEITTSREEAWAERRAEQNAEDCRRNYL